MDPVGNLDGQADSISRSHGRLRGAWAAWAVLGAAVAFVGLVSAAAAAREVGRADHREEHHAFETTATQVAGSLRRSIERHEDLVVSAAALVSESPKLSTSDLSVWLEAVRAQQRYPELLAIGLVAVVPQDDLTRFMEERTNDPASDLSPGDDLTILPPGERPFYCLLQASVAFEGGMELTPPGLDYCASDFGIGQLHQTLRDSGEASYVAASLTGGSPMLIVQSPVFSNAVVPPTVEERRQSYIGTLGVVLSPELVFASVLADHPQLTIGLAYESDGSIVEFASGPEAIEAEPIAVDLGNGWSARVTREHHAYDLFDHRAATAILVVGSAAALLLAGLVVALGTGRTRARRLVRQRTSQLHHQALHDALTGLPNRTLIIDRVEQLLIRCRRNGTTGAALFVDLDNFKNVNDTFGHDAGDQLLRLVATRMRGTLRAADTIGRMGGDEFVVLTDGETPAASATMIADRLLAALDEPFTIELDDGPCTLHVLASIGIAGGDRASAGDLLRDADLALYQAKADGRNRYRYFQPEMQIEVRQRLGLEIDLRHALAEGQFELHYQPIYNLDDLTVTGAEALLRWNHPTHGTTLPDTFVPILEQTGQIVEVGRWVLTEACRQAAGWRQAGSPLTIAINVSARQLDHGEIVDHVRDALNSSGLTPAALTLEVTETALMRDPVAIAERLQEIKQLGVRIAVDDFGTGYSSLAYLQRFPVDSLKIDRSFTTSIARSSQAEALIRTLVRLGNDLGLTTLAEGVETIEQLDQLRDENIQHVQGYLLARPLPASSFESTILQAPVQATPSENQR